MLPADWVCWRSLGVRLGLMLIAASMLAACDKCGDSIFRVDAGPIACKGEAPH